MLLNGIIGNPFKTEGVKTKKKYPRDYTRDELKVLKELWDTPHSYQMLVYAANPKGMQCSAGKNYIYINNEGYVTPCRKSS